MLCERCGAEVRERLVDDLRIDLAGFRVYWKGVRLKPLTRRYFLILIRLTDNVGNICTRQMLLDAVQDEGEIADRTIDAHITRMRRRFREIDPEFNHIGAARDYGYYWRSN